LSILNATYLYMAKLPIPENPEDAINLLLAVFGTKSNVAAIAGVTKGAVSHWKVIPPKAIPYLVDASKKKLTPEHLRPDLFGSR